MSTNSSAKPHLVQVRGLVDLYTSTLDRRGYQPTAIHAYRGAVEHFLAWAAPNLTPIPPRWERPPFGASLMSISWVVIALAAINVAR